MRQTDIYKILILVLCIFLITGCADRSYPGEEILSAGINRPVNGKYPILPSIGKLELTDDPSARATSSELKKKLWDNIYIYSYLKDASTDYSLTSSSPKDICIVDGLMQDESSNHGKRSVLSDKEPYITWTNTPMTVYFPDNDKAYNLFAYYLDGASTSENSVSKRPERIDIGVTIDGNNDVMCAKAEITDEQLSNFSFSETDKTNLINMSFSNITASRDIQPVIRFKHKLSKFVFFLFPAREDVGDVYIESISVKSKRYGTLTVASSNDDDMVADFSHESEKVDLWLCESDRTTLIKDKYHPIIEGVDFSKPVYERPYTQVGGALILPPGEKEYLFDLVLKQKKNDVFVYNRYSMPLQATPDDELFLAGNQYNVKLAVYGISDIRPQITITPWLFGGSVTLDPEKEFENKFN